VEAGRGGGGCVWLGVGVVGEVFVLWLGLGGWGGGGGGGWVVAGGGAGGLGWQVAGERTPTTAGRYHADPVGDGVADDGNAKSGAITRSSKLRPVPQMRWSVRRRLDVPKLFPCRPPPPDAAARQKQVRIGPASDV